MAFKRSQPYNDLPLLPPKADIESKTILKQCILARSELAALEQAGELLPNKSVLIHTIPLLEAQLSSEIENIVTTTDKLFQLASGSKQSADSATREALRYRQALYQGCKAIEKKPLCTSIAVEICSTIRDTAVDIRKVPGTTLSNPSTGQIIYTPPAGEQIIREKLTNWERFINEETSLDPLIRMAVMHYQFEAIHPFTDGNGRTGRILNALLLVQEQLLKTPILYLSRHFIRTKTQYYSLLRDVTENGNWHGWIIYVLQGIEETSKWTTRKIKAAQQLIEHTCDYVKQKLPRTYSRELVETVFEQPYCRIPNLIEKGIAARQTASVYLKRLTEIGLLEENQVGREKVYVHTKFLALLTQDENTFEPYTNNS
ncbi:Adenosine monophosphate-protein transferase SoFic [Anaerohalosphaera lusitana]|uniref:Adenosine monophosphate-protein transferase SoFic n=1 Tax=Anaerohalosphaera lusitana TaxID=1936003 RepID=A0A1U9NKP8_9BACT|nr:Fic family protein [Anaerohalosphaera lusitana]AQT68308.1 Adenosine monophosphate-protein transferase SoFic [Anaerohalosphaera lusitana]